MGSCFSNTTNPQTSVIHQEDSGNDLGKLSGKISSVAAPLDFQTKGDDILQSPDLKVFCLDVLKEATQGFHKHNGLGEGNFGYVCKGWIDEESLEAVQPKMGMPIAVKVINEQGCEGLEEFVAEIKSRKLCHPNIVKLIGYCLEDDHRLLVYEFMPRGSLDRYIYKFTSSYRSFSWNLRLKIAHNIAKGLAFLHDEANIIVRDLKTSGILLDSNYNAKLCDFGLSKDGPTCGNTHVTTRVLGTEEYSSPEYLYTGCLTKKSDVYSFGVVYLEMLSGKRARDKATPQREDNLVQWANKQLDSKPNFLKVLDDNILHEVRSLQPCVEKAFNLAEKCLSRSPHQRPDMKVVVQVLEQLYNNVSMCST